MKKLTDLRSELSVPKNQFNSFGKYKYRSQEDILEALKPLLKKYDLGLTISDDIVSVLDRVYIKATIIIWDNDKVITTSTGFAREPLSKKGMDESQITGAASSYARKYALNALFLIDDTKDADTDAHHEQTNKPEKKAPEFNRIEAIKKIDDLMKGKDDIFQADVQLSYNKCKTREEFTALYKQVKGEI